MAGYVIAHLTLKDPEPFEEYRKLVPGVIEQFGGRYLVRGGAVEAKEGDWTIPRLVIVEFESPDQARRFYDSSEYQAIIPLRQKGADGTVVIAEGV